MEEIKKRHGESIKCLLMNLNYWSYMYMFLPKLVPHILDMKNLKELILISNNRSM
jgi:hypothetical protein